MSQLISGLAGAGGAAANTGSYYTNAANDIYNTYGPSATKYFTREENQALQKQFNDQDQAMLAGMAAKGLAKSGAGQYNFGNLGAEQSGVIAGADAPIFSQGLAGAANVYSQMPGAQATSYDNAIQQFYQALSMASQAAAGIPPSAGPGPSTQGYSPGGGSGGTGYYAPGDPSGLSNTPYIP